MMAKLKKITLFFVFISLITVIIIFANQNFLQGKTTQKEVKKDIEKPSTKLEKSKRKKKKSSDKKIDKRASEAKKNLIKLRIIVLDFVNRTKFNEYDFFSKTIADIINNELIKSNNFTVISRDTYKSHFERLKLKNEFLFNDDVASVLGQLCNVDIVIVGNYTIYKSSMKLMIKAIDIRKNKIRAVYEKNVYFAGVIPFDSLDKSANEVAKQLKKALPPEPPKIIYMEKNKYSKKFKERIVYLKKESKLGFGGIIRFNFGKSFYGFNIRTEQTGKAKYPDSKNFSLHSQIDLVLFYKLLLVGISYYSFEHDAIDYSELADNGGNYPDGDYVKNVRVSDLHWKIGVRIPSSDDHYNFNAIYLSWHRHNVKLGDGNEYEGVGTGLGVYLFYTFDVGLGDYMLMFDTDIYLSYLHKIRYSERYEKITQDESEISNSGIILGGGMSLGFLHKRIGAFFTITPYAELNCLYFQRKYLDVPNPPSVDGTDRMKLPFGNIFAGFKIGVGYYFDSSVWLDKK